MTPPPSAAASGGPQSSGTVAAGLRGLQLCKVLHGLLQEQGLQLWATAQAVRTGAGPGAHLPGRL